MEMSSTPSQFTGEEIARYLQQSFPDRELHEFLLRIDESFRCGGLFIAHREGKIRGVLIGIIRDPSVFYVCWLKADGKEFLRQIIDAGVRTHGYLDIIAQRNGKVIAYKTSKLLRKLYG